MRNKIQRRNDYETIHINIGYFKIHFKNTLSIFQGCSSNIYEISPEYAQHCIAQPPPPSLEIPLYRMWFTSLQWSYPIWTQLDGVMLSFLHGMADPLVIKVRHQSNDIRASYIFIYESQIIRKWRSIVERVCCKMLAVECILIDDNTHGGDW